MSQKKGNGWPDILKAALVGYDAERRRIEEKIAALQGELRGRKTIGPTAGAKSKKRVLSVAARKRIAAAQRKRWAEHKQAMASGTQPKRKLSAAGRARIVEANRRRWAELRKRHEGR